MTEDSRQEKDALHEYGAIFTEEWHEKGQHLEEECRKTFISKFEETRDQLRTMIQQRRGQNVNNLIITIFGHVADGAKQSLMYGKDGNFVNQSFSLAYFLAALIEGCNLIASLDIKLNDALEKEVLERVSQAKGAFNELGKKVNKEHIERMIIRILRDNRNSAYNRDLVINIGRLISH